MALIKEEPNIRPMAAFGRRETAVILGVSEKTIDTWTLDGSLPISGIRPNTRKFFLGKTIIACWKKQTYGDAVFNRTYSKQLQRI